MNEQISNSMKEKVKNVLNEVAATQDMKVLFACESASRAWGFTSPDSDYDVRFIYTNPKNWYFNVNQSRDVYDEMLTDDLDLCGWELRKTLQLFAESNVALYEWIGSPIVYSQNDELLTQLKELIPEFFNAKRAMYHYLAMASKIVRTEMNESSIKIKKLFYIIRSILACEWIGKYKTMPHTLFSELLKDADLDADIEEFVIARLKDKEVAVEALEVELPDEIINWLSSQLGLYGAAAQEMPSETKGSMEDLNKILYNFAS